MKTLTNCTECNKPGGTIPHYYMGSSDMEEAKEMMHEECAKARIEHYLNRKENENA